MFSFSLNICCCPEFMLFCHGVFQPHLTLHFSPNTCLVGCVTKWREGRNMHNLCNLLLE
ncbi:hypothetical protein CIPAW_04G171800 [Carya illinoinensis]|uniref:Uncharacterized protein n=1 Tax=Carya illinoinensis TaxID=32201 RepID=A0A8T1QWD9_CARIL|nr:hypothetical protein CIPAW_04G171800 [Carya illinoinensis]KAG6658578.1 hypothetical protein CIPAW_04G171800 [Carya illinoinensis]KAG6658579.1 hypothetical protein CIPAW_04G171800 [Carya illinoinensis]